MCALDGGAVCLPVSAVCATTVLSYSGGCGVALPMRVAINTLFILSPRFSSFAGLLLFV